ncbi:MAG: nucleotidyltransferase family protein [Vicinamibacteria bacterium]
MDRDSTLELLRSHLPEMRKRFDAQELWIFGSIARDEARETSDIDVMVVFSEPATLDRFMGLKFYLEDLLERSVDLTTRKALHPRLRPHIEREAVRVA